MNIKDLFGAIHGRLVLCGFVPCLVPFTDITPILCVSRQTAIHQAGVAGQRLNPGALTKGRCSPGRSEGNEPRSTAWGAAPAAANRSPNRPSAFMWTSVSCLFASLAMFPSSRKTKLRKQHSLNFLHTTISRRATFLSWLQSQVFATRWVTRLSSFTC